jgi:hypothetical protein
MRRVARRCGRAHRPWWRRSWGGGGLRCRISLVLAAMPRGCSLHADVGWIDVGQASDLPQSVQLHSLMTSGRFGAEIWTWPQRQDGVSVAGLYQAC